MFIRCLPTSDLATDTDCDTITTFRTFENVSRESELFYFSWLVSYLIVYVNFSSVQYVDRAEFNKLPCLGLTSSKIMRAMAYKNFPAKFLREVWRHKWLIFENLSNTSRLKKMEISNPGPASGKSPLSTLSNVRQPLFFSYSTSLSRVTFELRKLGSSYKGTYR